ncbi:uncharacterized protein LOC133779503 [Humulus lupulus]|uniref:uncharacterized protein LOC133779503 n=1 Tax=Humulus lupulus TaxID=3486 RepID=UPI002B415038|nr:uncharacterized protein LOC133779503 [Humulus lupulus]
MSFGLTYAPTTFIDLMNKVFEDYLDRFMKVFINDILLYSQLKLEHELHLWLVLQRLREHKLYAKFRKCEFWLSQVTFFGHIVSREGIMVDLAKIGCDIEPKAPKRLLKLHAAANLPSVSSALVLERQNLVKGNMQLFSVEQHRSQALEAHAAAFAQFNVRNENPSTLISFATKTFNAGQITSNRHRFQELFAKTKYKEVAELAVELHKEFFVLLIQLPNFRFFHFAFVVMLVSSCVDCRIDKLSVNDTECGIPYCGSLLLWDACQNGYFPLFRGMGIGDQFQMVVSIIFKQWEIYEPN